MLLFLLTILLFAQTSAEGNFHCHNHSVCVALPDAARDCPCVIIPKSSVETLDKFMVFAAKLLGSRDKDQKVTYRILSQDAIDELNVFCSAQDHGEEEIDDYEKYPRLKVFTSLMLFKPGDLSTALHLLKGHLHSSVLDDLRNCKKSVCTFSKQIKMDDESSLQIVKAAVMKLPDDESLLASGHVVVDSGYYDDSSFIRYARDMIVERFDVAYHGFLSEKGL
ncbi:hypothetical protein QR680_015024 [Steinernema hermaphroditum]|uniref:Uncharacterized protein n=1 Tax=Steinernema hermaphroditum TaxID=289476 RepID=A0AA39IDE6_9BILA|nr:hypothetical protein QR680_015024 [Steinernema hermaphroditum]